MKNILITGSSGFLGEELVNYFSEENKIYALDKALPLEFKKNYLNIKKITCDIRDKVTLNKIFNENKIDTIIHCAAEILDEKDPKEVWRTNYDGTKNLLDFAEQYSVEKFIFTSNEEIKL